MSENSEHLFFKRIFMKKVTLIVLIFPFSKALQRLLNTLTPYL